MINAVQIQRLYLVLSIVTLSILSPSWALSKQSTVYRAPTSAEEKPEGGVAGGGGFEYYNSPAKINIIKARDYIVKLYKYMPSKQFSRILRMVSEQTQNSKVLSINQEKLVAVIENMRADFTSNTQRKNTDGVLEFLVMNYDLQKNTITALRPLFQAYNRDVLTTSEKDRLHMIIIHEALHIFNIGIEDDLEASQVTHSLIEKTWNYFNYFT